MFGDEIDLRAHQIDVHGEVENSQSGNKDSKIKIEFRVKREGRGGEGYEDDGNALMGSSSSAPDANAFAYGLDGSAFVPAVESDNSNIIANNNNGDLADDDNLDPVHRERVKEIREEAAKKRDVAFDGEGNVVEEYPSLATAGGDAARKGFNVKGSWSKGEEKGGRGGGGGGGGGGSSKQTEDNFPTLPKPSRVARSNLRHDKKVMAKFQKPHAGAGNFLGGVGAVFEAAREIGGDQVVVTKSGFAR